MHLQQYLIFEVCRECNLGKRHKLCPNMHEQRFGALPTDRAMTDDKIVETARSLYREHGFRGRVGWHYYNEPLMAKERMFRLMDRIDEQVSESRYTLWTNGLLLDANDPIERFEEIHVTVYTPSPTKEQLARFKRHPGAHIHKWPLDDRLDSQGRMSRKPCERMFTEIIFDYFGNLRLCCYDWRGFGSPGDIHTSPVEELVKRWHEIRHFVSGAEMAETSPLVCLLCKKRARGLSHFVPEIAIDAERFCKEAAKP